MLIILSRIRHVCNKRQELLISVDYLDKPLKPINKQFAHKNEIIQPHTSTLYTPTSHTHKPSLIPIQSTHTGPPILHRAFSIFHFSFDMKLLITQRSHTKQTFPLLWSNSCCSHPLWSNTHERGGPIGLDDLTMYSMPFALKRRMREELNTEMELNDFQFLTRFMYLAKAGKSFAEYEMDYIYISISKEKSENLLNLVPNSDEVENFKFVDKNELQKIIFDLKFTPWSLYLLHHFIFDWWDKLGTPQWDNTHTKKIYYADDITNFKI
uniref:isopentenyl-diphosphate Delta-isomerase n=1 Tax=Nephromyces sp. MMRI TaxID=2496275 RepID=A0A3S8V3F2_9APIC|nr:isopentenyl diphosphate isomerase [Nephromyces sp. MMRI]